MIWVIFCSHYYFDNTEITAFAASIPFVLDLTLACFIFKHVMTPLPIGFLNSTERFIIAFVVANEIKSKCGVSPLITHPNAIKPSYFFIFFDITTGISKTPGTWINLNLLFFLKITWYIFFV